MSDTEHGLRIGRRYRIDLHSENSFWTIDGTLHSFVERRHEWYALVENYRGKVVIIRDDDERAMKVAGDGLELPLAFIITAKEITQ